MKRILTVSCVFLALIVGFAAGFRTALAREHNRLEHNKQLLRRVHKEVWSNPDHDAAMKAIDELYTPDFVLHDWTGDSHGATEVKKGVADTRAAFPDSLVVLFGVVAGGGGVRTCFGVRWP